MPADSLNSSAINIDQLIISANTSAHICISICAQMYLPTHLIVHISMCQHIYISTYLHVYRSKYPFIIFYIEFITSLA